MTEGLLALHDTYHSKAPTHLKYTYTPGYIAATYLKHLLIIYIIFIHTLISTFITRLIATICSCFETVKMCSENYLEGQEKCAQTFPTEKLLFYRKVNSLGQC